MSFVKKLLDCFKFTIQQVVSNSNLVNEAEDSQQKLFGLIWNIKSDSISPKKFILDGNCTKRDVLRAFAQNCDPNNYLGPLLNIGQRFFFITFKMILISNGMIHYLEIESRNGG